MQKPPEIRRLAWPIAAVLDQHGADDEHLGSDGYQAGGRHFEDTHCLLL